MSSSLRPVTSLVHLTPEDTQLEGIENRLRDIGRLKHEVEGIKIAIIGATNAGKSSLLNAITGRDCAIVTDVHGTTRDVVSEETHLDGMRFLFHDTAGFMGSGANEADMAAMRKTKETVDGSEKVLLVLDKSRKPNKNDIDCVEFLKTSGKPFTIVLNKTDLPPVMGKEEVRQLAGEAEIIEVSALQGAGLDALKRKMSAGIGRAQLPPEERPVFSARYEGIFRGIRDSLVSARTALERGEALDRIVQEIRYALKFAGEVTGETTTEEILDSIFKGFCLGK